MRYVQITQSLLCDGLDPRTPPRPAVNGGNGPGARLVELIDYKTGSLPSSGEVARGLAPQLPLEALMIERGGFAALGSGQVAGLDYWRLSGGDPPGEIKSLGADPAKLRALIALSLIQL